MAQRNRSATQRRPHRFLTARPDSAVPTEPDSAGADEFDELDVWGCGGGGGGGGGGSGESPWPSDPARAPRRGRSKKEKAGRVGGCPGSLPVSVPRWGGTDGGDEAGRGWVVVGDSPGGEVTTAVVGFEPPHEVLLRRCRAASFSVQEGLGRTLKGRDLSRVRNAVWAKIGFED